MTKRQVAEFSQLLKSKVDFRGELRTGDTFALITSREMTDSQITGQTRIEALMLQRGAHDYHATLRG